MSLDPYDINIAIPITVPVSDIIVPEETYTIAYHDLRALVTIGNWKYCTELNTPIDLDKLDAIIEKESPLVLNRVHTLVGRNVIIENNNHDIGEINFHYRRLISDVILPSIDDPVDNKLTRVIGVRQCAGVIVKCRFNTRVDTKKLLHLYPYATMPSNGMVCLEVGLLMHYEELQDGMTMFKFSAQEYQNLCEAEALHRGYNEMLDKSIDNREDITDMSSVERAKVCILPTGDMYMTGTLNRRATINAVYNVMQAVASCV